MDLITARTRAVNEMTKHGLIEKGWRFEFDRATSRLGRCNFSRKLITISKHFTGAATLEQFEQTLFHEVAHALLPVSVKHGALWKMKAKQLGYHGKRTSHNPYYEQEQAKKRVDVFTTKPVTGGEGRYERGAPKVLVTAQTATMGAPKVGDLLILPNGAKLKVEEVTARQTKAVEVGSGAVWNLSTPDAYRFLQN